MAFLAENDYEQAVQSFDRALTRSPRYAFALANKADALRLWRHYQDVSDFWEEFRFQTARAGEAKARPAEAMFEYGGATGRLPPKDPVPVAGD